MGSDAATANNASPAVSNDVGGKKKKTNRSAKLKQCKLDARREQWLSQVKKNKSWKVASNAHGAAFPLARMDKPNVPRTGNGGNNSALMRSKSEQNGRAMGFHDGDPNSLASRKDCLASSRCYLRSVRGVNEDDDEVKAEGSLDDWEAVADALTAPKHAASAASAVPQTGDGILRRPEPERRILRAWRPDDVFRPQTLPRHQNFSLSSSQWCCSQGTMSWANHGITSQPSLCPICYENLDLTDTSFLPCSCGFRLCLFCHKRILEAGDGRCPGCRKQYSPLGNGEGMCMSGGGVPLLSLRLARSCRSMSSRS